MNDLLARIQAGLQQYQRDELLTLVVEYLAMRNEPELTAFLNLMRQPTRPMLAEPLELEAAADLLAQIRELYDALANDEYVQYGAGYDPDYGEYRGFGDDSWIEAMDSLFATTTRFYLAGDYQTAAHAYQELFHIFSLSEDGFHFTRPDPAAALQTDLPHMRRYLLHALGMLDPDPAALVVDDDRYDLDERSLIGLSRELALYSDDRYALLDAWQQHPAWLHNLERYLRASCTQPDDQEDTIFLLGHEATLLREWHRRWSDLPERERLCQEIGAQQGWPYVDLVDAYQSQEQWEQALKWAEAGLLSLPERSSYRANLEEARGRALLKLGRPDAALATLPSLFVKRPNLPTYLTLREAAQAQGNWSQVFTDLTSEAEQQVLSQVANRSSGFSLTSIVLAELLGFAYLLDGDIKRALGWGSRPEIPSGWGDSDLQRTLASGLLRMVLMNTGRQADAVLQKALQEATALIQAQGQLLEVPAQRITSNLLFDGTVHMYDQLLQRAVAWRKREYYALAGGYAQVIQAVRTLQGRPDAFTSYYQGLFETYPRLPAFQDELRKAIEGSRSRPKRRR